MAINNKLPLHTRLGTYFTVLIVVLVCFLLLRNCVNAVYYGAVTNDKDLSRYYESGFEEGEEKGYDNGTHDPFRSASSGSGKGFSLHAGSYFTG